jgi:plasmid stabilization system protein ParE
MSRYTVTWHPEAEAELIELWLDAQDRNQVAEAVRTIDAALAMHAEARGDPVAEGLRGLNAPPLRVIFTVRPADRVTEIELVRRL